MRIGIYFSDLFNKIGDNIDVLPLLNINNQNSITTIHTFSRNKSNQRLEKVNQTSGNLIWLLYKIFINRREIDVFHVFCGLKWTVPIIIFFLKFINIKVIYSPFGQLLPFHKENKGIFKILIIEYFFKYTLKNISIHCSSKYELNFLKTWQIKNVYFFLVPLAVKSEDRTRRFETIKKNKTILFFGRLDVWQKGIDKLLQSINISKNELNKNQFNVVLAGKCSESEFSSINSLIEKYNLNKLVKVMPNVSNSERERLYINSYLFFHPSRIEGLARSMRDAFNYQLPILTTYDSNADYYFDKKKIGFITCFDENLLSQALNQMIKINPIEYLNYRKNLFDLCVSYNSNKYQESMFSIYHDIIKNNFLNND